MNKKKAVKRAFAVVLSLSLLQTPLVSLADSYVTDNTQQAMENASVEGGGMVYNIPAATGDELAALKVKYADLYEKPESGGETEFPAEYSRTVLEESVGMTDEEIEPIVTALINTMTFKEKLALIADPGWGTDKVEKDQANYSPGVPRLGVPVVRQHDGSAGTQAIYPTTNLPTENVMANTFDTDLAGDYGSVIGSELVSIGSNYELGTQFDLVRDMRWGRAKDTFGEDYYLASEMSTYETIGLQAEGAGAQAKHIGAYATNGDSALWTFVDEQTLHTAYLYPFEEPVKRANLSEIMTTYTRLNGYFTFSNTYLLKDTLRGMWDFKGGVVTDAMSTTEFTTILGIDSEMGRNYNTEAYVLTYMDQGLCTMEDIDAAASHMLWSFGYAGYLGLVQIDEETGLAKEDIRRGDIDDDIHYVMAGTDVSEGGDRAVIELPDTWAEDYEEGTVYEENNEIALQTAEEGIVLLKNENADGDAVLPLTEDDYTGDNKVILVGNLADAIVSGTGSERSHGFLDYMTTPYEALKDAVGEENEDNIEAYVLEDDYGTVIPADVIYTSADEDENGFVMDGGEVVSEINYLTTYQTNKNSIQNQEDGKAFPNGESHSWEGYLEAPADGDYDIIIGSMGGSASVTISSLDGSVIGEEETSSGGFPGGWMPWSAGDVQTLDVEEKTELSATSNNTALPTDFFDKDGLVVSTVTATLEAGKRYKIEVNSTAASAEYDQQVKLTWKVPGQDEATEQAALAAAAKTGNKVIYFVRIGLTGHGVTPDEEDLPMYEDDLEFLQKLQAACHENGNDLILVSYNRTAFAFDGDWADDTDAILAAFYPGQAGQQAIANLLMGTANPSAKLSVTLPKTYKETLLYYDEWDLNGNGEYDEGESYEDYLAWQRVGQGGQKFKDTEREYSAQYNEGLNFGYRWYELEDIEPEYAFGYGLSYSSFAYDNVQVTYNGDYTYTVTVDVTNTSDVDGADVVQIYAADDVDVPDSVQVAETQLVAFDRVEVPAGETVTAKMTISRDMLSYWYADMELTEHADNTADKRIIADGERTFTVATSSSAADVITALTIDVQAADVDLTGIENALANVPDDYSDYAQADVVEALIDAAEEMLTREGTPEDDSQAIANGIAASLNAVVESLGQSEEAEDSALVDALVSLKSAAGAVPATLEDDAVQALVAAANAYLAVSDDLTGADVDAIDTLTAAITMAASKYDISVGSTEEMVRENLKAICEVWGAMDLSGYTDESAAALQAALADAEAVLADANASLADVQAAQDALIAAFAGLQQKETNKLALSTTIEAAEAILKDARNYASVDELAAAVEAGRAVLEDEDATQQEIDDATAEILHALQNLADAADVSALAKLIESAKNLLDGSYTNESLADLQAAIEAAEAVIADQSRSDNAIAAAYQDLIDAIINLQASANKAALSAILAQADDVLGNAGAYVASTIEGLDELTASARTVYDNAAATQEEVDAAVIDLTLAVADARLLGDVDGNGVINTSDSALILQYAAEINELSDEALESADVNADGVVDTSDAVNVLRYAAEIITQF